MIDHHVDRLGVERQQCPKLTSTNRSFGLIDLTILAHAYGSSHVTCAPNSKAPKAHTGFHSSPCESPTWWSWRGACTRSHPELGRENPQRRWYCVSRRGRVGHRQVCNSHRDKTHDPIPQEPRPRATSSTGTYSTTAGWSSPVARQAHNLKVRGSNPLPATPSPITAKRRFFYALRGARLSLELITGDG